MSAPIAQRDVPDYGEPWEYTSFRNCIRDRHQVVREIQDGLRDRSRSCVNACAGMADPGAQIQAMREVISAAHKCRHWHDTQDGVIISAESFWALRDALARLQSINS